MLAVSIFSWLWAMALQLAAQPAVQLTVQLVVQLAYHAASLQTDRAGS
jgi:hypothetical protein